MPSPGDLPDPGIKLGSPTLQADSLPTELSGENSVKLQGKKQKEVMIKKQQQQNKTRKE